MTIEGLQPYMTYDKVSRVITLDKFLVPPSALGDSSIKVIISDQKGASNEYVFHINLYEDGWEEEKADTNFTQPVEKERGSPGGNVTAYIHSVSIFGEMEIRFNASMFTNFNFSLLNASLVDIYVIPY